MRVVLMIMTASVCIAGELPVAEAQSAANLARQVSLSGSALHDNDGSLLGLGATYMQALRRAKFDRPRLHSDLSFLAQNGFNYVRILSMVGWYPFWDGLEISPISFQDQQGNTVAGWPDYWQQFRDTIDIAYDDHGLRTQITIFADAQLMPDKATRMQHMDAVLANLANREHKVIMLEVANEAWQNGFPGVQGVADVREFGQYLADRTEILVALSATFESTNAAIEQMYAGSAADIATVHFERDTSTVEGGWLPVRDAWQVSSAVGVPPVSNNEPIGPGSSVDNETDPIKLVAAAAFAWMANLPMYVFHSDAGVRGLDPFQDKPGVDKFGHVLDILPADVANWQRNDGIQASAPFTVFAGGQANTHWPDISNPASGVVRNTGSVRQDKFFTLPIGILGGGVELQARQDMTFQVFNPLTGVVVLETTKRTDERFTLPQGPEAYIIKGTFAGDGPAEIDLGSPNAPNGMVHPQGGDGDTKALSIGARPARGNLDANQDFYFYLDVADWFAFQGNQAELYITIDYFDVGNGSLTLQYDSNTGNTLPAFYKDGGSIAIMGSETWLRHTFHVTDAYFGNRQNQGADFRIFGGAGNTFYLDLVLVSKTPSPFRPEQGPL